MQANGGNSSSSSSSGGGSSHYLHGGLSKKLQMKDENSDDDFEVVGEGRPLAPEDPLEAPREKARSELRQFLSSRGVDPARADAYQLLIKKEKSGGGYVFKVRYVATSSAGSNVVLDSKREVFEHIQKLEQDGHRGSKSGGSGGGHSSSSEGRLSEHKRMDIYHAARKETQAKQENLPSRLGGINLINLGFINSGIKHCHTAVQLYPVGYKCEQSLIGPSAIPGKTRSLPITCEILKDDSSERLEFKIVHNTSVFIGLSESDVWRKFGESITEPKENWSFFNLDIELLIEGLAESISCKHYRYHAERGYPNEYSSNDAAYNHKKNLLNKIEREKRLTERSKTSSSSCGGGEKAQSASSSSDWISRPEKKVDERKAESAEDKAKRLEETKMEKERIKKEEAELRDRKKQEESQLRDRKKQEESQLRDRKKQEEAASRERKNAEKKQQHLRMLSRVDRSINGQERQKIMKGVKVQEVDSMAAIFDFFCREEDERELMTHNDSMYLADEGSSSKLNLDSILNLGDNCTMKSLGVEFQSFGNEPELSFDKLVSFAQQLCSYAVYLELDMPVSLEIVVDHLKTIASHEDKLLESNAFNPFINSKSSTVDIDDDTSNGERVIISNHSSENLHSIDEQNDNSVEDEAEWQDTKPLSKSSNVMHVSDARSSVSSSTNKSVDEYELKQKLNRAEAFFDRIQLSLAKALLPPLNAAFDMIEKDNKGVARTIKIPLNELTWAEICRQALIIHMCRNFNRGEKDEILHWIRGSKQSHFESQGNIIKLLRYKMAMISRGDKINKEQESLHSSLSDDITFASPKYDAEDHLLPKEFLKYGDNRNPLESTPFTTLGLPSSAAGGGLPAVTVLGSFEADPDDANYDEIILSLERICQSGTVEQPSKYLESFKRCSKVFIKLLRFCNNEKFLHDVRDLIYDQFFDFKRPMSITMIYNNLVNQLYGDYESDNNYRSVCLDFYRDMRQFIVNCFVYAENRPFVARAQKLLLILDRYMDKWVLDPNRPPVESCDDNHCLLSRGGISVMSSIKCGRCTAIFSLQSLSCDERKAGFQDDVRDKTPDKEKWFCPLCVGDFRSDRRSIVEFDSPFHLSEWGPSGLVPWFLNANHSIWADKLLQAPDLADTFTALELLSARSITSMITSSKDISSNNSNSNGNSNSNITCSDFSSRESRLWSPFKRILIYLGLFEVLKADPKVVRFMDDIFSKKFEKLVKMCKGGNDKQEILALVGEIADPKAVEICADLLEDMDNAKSGECLICKGEFDADEDTVILCDGCDGEVHLRCIGRSTVPLGDWFCLHCQFKKKENASKSDVVEEIELFKDIRNHTSKDLVDELVFLKSKGKESPNHLILCSICNKNELELCSPMVLGQSSREHELFMNEFTPPYNSCGLEFPYFPVVNCDNARSLIEIQQSLPVVHEFCALHLFKTRVNRDRHSLIRRRQVVSDIALSLSNAGTLPLGKDDAGRDYWKFPCSDDLYVYAGPTQDPDKAEFERELLKARQSSLSDMAISDSSSSSSSSSSSFSSFACVWPGGFTGWKRFQDISTIKNVSDALGESKGEKALKKNIQNRLILPRQIYAKVVLREATRLEDAKREAVSRLDEAKMREIREDNEEDEMEFGGRKVDTTSYGMELSDSSAVGKGSSSASVTSGMKQELLEFLHGLPEGITNPDEIPVRVILALNKSYDVSQDLVLPTVPVFEDNEEYEYWGDRYVHDNRKGKRFAITLVNRNNEPLIFEKKEKVFCCFRIYRVGVPDCLWEEDVHFYAQRDCCFKSIEFKRPGRYKLFFGIKGCEYYSYCQPYETIVNVVAESIDCGPSFALAQLNAKRHMLLPSRQIPTARSYVSHMLQDMSSELACAKSILMHIYVSLPNGSLILESDNPDTISLVNGGSGGGYRASSSAPIVDNIFSFISDAKGWSDYMHQAWIGAVEAASNVLEITSCVLILQNYISPKWLEGPCSKLMVALGNSRFALQSVSYPTLFMRLFSLDSSLNFEKYEQPQRFKRASSTTVKDIEPMIVEKPKPASASRSRGGKPEPENRSRRNRPAVNYNYDDYDNGDDFDDDRSDGMEVQRSRKVSKRSDFAPLPSLLPSVSDGWTCMECNTHNAGRTRSCDACGCKKPPVSFDGGPEYSTNKSRELNKKASRKKKKKVIVASSDDDDEDEDEDEDDEDEEEEDDDDDDISRPRKRQANSRKNQSRNIDEIDDSNESVDSNESEKKSSRTAGNKRRLSALIPTARSFSRKKTLIDDEDDEVEDEDIEENDDDDDDDDDNDGGSFGRRTSSRKKSRVNYREDIEDDEGDDIVEEKISVRPPKKRVVISNEGDTPKSPPFKVPPKKGGAAIRSKKSTHSDSDGDGGSDDSGNNEDDTTATSSVVKSTSVFNFPIYIITLMKELQAALASESSSSNINISNSSSGGSSSKLYGYGINVGQMEIQIRQLLILEVLYNMPFANLFFAPVDICVIPTYHKIIKNPMDLGTVCKRVRAGYYGTDNESYLHDVRLVFKNCAKFNIKNEDILNLGSALSAAFEEKYKLIILDEDRQLLSELVNLDS